MELLDKTVFSKFPHRCAIKYYDSQSSLVEVSYEQLWCDIQKIATALEGQRIVRQLIGVQFPHCPALIAVIGGIIISGNSFSCLHDDARPDGHLPLIDNHHISACFIPDRRSLECSDQWQLTIGMRILSTPVALAVKSPQREWGEEEIAFCVQTSGSTGTPKTILVPKSCIMPNVLALSARFQLSERDLIFVCSPPTFDPFVVDILLGLRAAATLLLVDNKRRLAATRLAQLLFPGVTFMQITPSLFTRWSSREIAETILAPHSTLRVLVLGGEKFPQLTIPMDSRTDVYNIYGISEISCWSTMEKMTHGRWTDVPLGVPLDSSLIMQLRSVDDDQQLAERNEEGSTVGHLFIGSKTRKCIVLDDSENDFVHVASEEPLFRATGDLVELAKDNRYFYRGRCARVIKRYGCRVSLHELEEALRSHELIEQCAACVVGDDMQLVMFFKASKEHVSLEATTWQHLRSTLPARKLPDEIYRAEYIPLSSHGKISNGGLLKLYDQLKRHRTVEKLSYVELFRAELLSIGISVPRLRNSDEMKRRKINSFIDHGGTSICALRLHATMEKASGVALPQLLTYLLDATVSLEDAFKYLESKDRLRSSVETSISLSKEKSDRDRKDNEKLTIVCRYDMGKCIDSRPTVVFCKDLGHILTVGSHSGLLLTISVETNGIVSRLSLPDRIECSVSFFQHQTGAVHGVVGCYDGYLYCFNPLDGCIVWKYDAGGMIKCRPLVVAETNAIIFGSYGSTHNLHCIRGSDAGAVQWQTRIGTKPILAQPIALGGPCAGNVFVASLDGTIASVDTGSGMLVWSRTLSGNVPIFSTPAYFDCHGKVIVCRVDGTMSVHETVHGKESSSISLPGNVFSSLETLKRSRTEISLFVGCYDRSVHCVDYLPAQRDALTRKWKVDMPSQIYATPVPVLVGRVSLLLVCSTSGHMSVIELANEQKAPGSETENAKIASTLQLNGELFATPVVHGNVAFVGCRDNFLYKIVIK